MSDHGYFGPDSITWKIHAHPTMIVGGLRALLVQALNPLAMAAVDQHSSYKADPWARLVRTTEYIVATTYGDTETADAAAARVRAIHKHVSGVDPFTGRSYRADDPELLLWIHCAEIHSFMTGYRVFGPGLSDDEIDRYVSEMVAAAELVGLHRDDVPASYAELRDYLDGEELVASPAAKAALRFVLFPPVVWPGGAYPQVPGGRLLEVPGRMGWAIPSTAAVATLPASARRAYGLPRLSPAIPALKMPLKAFIRAMRMVAPPPPGLAEARARMGYAA
ncbi:MAG TPA: oxygenase MpaB family protein [Actinomycetota bacterium]|nr:oxygenase MpaB family protein [Actinomycetota bacterium]